MQRYQALKHMSERTGSANDGGGASHPTIFDKETASAFEFDHADLFSSPMNDERRQGGGAKASASDDD